MIVFLLSQKPIQLSLGVGLLLLLLLLSLGHLAAQLLFAALDVGLDLIDRMIGEIGTAGKRKSHE